MVKKKSIGDLIDRLMTERFETYGIRCPRCGTLLLRPKTADPITGKKLAGACPGVVTYEDNGKLRRKKCGYVEPLATRTTPNAEELTTIAHNNDAIGYLRAFSITSSPKILRHRFDNYQISTESEQRVLDRCRQISKLIATGKPIHSILAGPTGRGKTHLAMGILYDVFERTGYKTVKTVIKNGEPELVYVSWKALFVDWHELIEQQKQSFDDESLKKKINKILAEIRTADVVVLDDFGSERDTDYSQDLVDRFWRDRENKTVIVTTNLEGKALTERYGARTLSRMKNYGIGNNVAFSAIKDYRGSFN